jgi:5'(3')-deoxyribonucleotidase
MTILVDMDDTIEQLLKALVNRANERFHRSVSVEDVTDWSIVCAFPGIEKKQIQDFMREPDFWKDVEPVPGAAEALKHFMDEGHQVYIVTATESEHVNEKMKGVLYKYFPFISWDHVIVTSRKQMIRGDILIDDGIHNLEGGEYRKILFTAPYNRNYDAETNGMIRVHNWNEIVEIIDRMK